MKETMAYCGLICDTCPIYLATRQDDPKKKLEMRAEIARQIEEIYGQKNSAEDIGDCDGCKAETGRLFSTGCEIKQCAIGKQIENCAYCSEYACDKLEKLFISDGGARERLDEIRSSL